MAASINVVRDVVQFGRKERAVHEQSLYDESRTQLFAVQRTIKLWLHSVEFTAWFGKFAHTIFYQMVGTVSLSATEKMF